MKWISVKKELPPTHTRVMVCRELRLEGFEPMLTHDIGMLKGTESSDRWELDSQRYCALPCESTLRSGIISHWMQLPKLPQE